MPPPGSTGSLFPQKRAPATNGTGCSSGQSVLRAGTRQLRPRSAPAPGRSGIAGSTPPHCARSAAERHRATVARYLPGPGQTPRAPYPLHLALTTHGVWRQNLFRKRLRPTTTGILALVFFSSSIYFASTIGTPSPIGRPLVLPSATTSPSFKPLSISTWVRLMLPTLTGARCILLPFTR